VAESHAPGIRLNEHEWPDTKRPRGSTAGAFSAPSDIRQDGPTMVLVGHSRQ
jgi:hypothetical protein